MPKIYKEFQEFYDPWKIPKTWVIVAGILKEREIEQKGKCYMINSISLPIAV